MIVLSVVIALVIGCKYMRFDQKEDLKTEDRQSVHTGSRVLQHVHMHSNVPVLESAQKLSFF
jgi:hypothetical protein